MLIGFSLLIIVLLLTGMPVAFALMFSGVLGMLFFLGGPAARRR